MIVTDEQNTSSVSGGNNSLLDFTYLLVELPDY